MQQETRFPATPSRVILVGEALMDVFPDGSRVPGGAPLNVACHLAALGLDPLLVTRVGEDADGEGLVAWLCRRGLEVIGVQRDAALPTGEAGVRDGGGPAGFEIPYPRAFDRIDLETVRAGTAGTHPAAIYFGTLAQRDPVSREAIRWLLVNIQGVRFCDVNLRDPWTEPEIVRDSLLGADVAKLNEDELPRCVALLNGRAVSGHGAAVRLARKAELRSLVVTAGDRGARRVEHRDGATMESWVAASRPRPIVDTVGAGDGFSAVLLLGLLHGWNAGKTLERAAELAGALCTIRGAVPLDAGFYEPFRERWGISA